VTPDRPSATTTRSRLITVATLLGLLCVPTLQAQKGGGGGKGAGSSSSQSDDSDDTSVPVCPQIVGSHPLLEKLTLELRMTCQQEVKILPLMHDEETVTRLLLVYAAFTPDERQAMLLKVELAARAQVLPFLLPEQQKKSDADAASLAAKPPKKIGRKKDPPAAEDAFVSEEALSSAIDSYSALTTAQKKEMLLQIKQAARRNRAPALTPEQIAKIDGDIAFLQH
jgi:hypothetical protein